MGRFEVRAHIARKPKDVHAFIQDFDRYPEWIPFTKEVVSTDRTPNVVGTKYTERGTGGKSVWEVVEYDAGHREVHRGDIGVARVRVDMQMAPADVGTDYQHVIEYEMKVPVIGWLIDKLVLGRKMRTGLDETVANLKRILEDESTA